MIEPAKKERLMQIQKVLNMAAQVCALFDLEDLTDHEAQVVVKCLGIMNNPDIKVLGNEEMRKRVLNIICDEMHVAVDQIT